MARRRYDEDPVIKEYNAACRRANALFALSIVFALGWGATLFIGTQDASQVTIAFNSLARTVLGWVSVTALAFSLLHAAYAIAFFFLKMGRW